MKTSRQEKTESLILIIKGNSPKTKTECRSNDTTHNHNSLSATLCLRSAFVYAHVHAAQHVEIPQPHPKHIHQKSLLTLQHSVTALSHAAIFVSFPHLLLHQQHFAELQPSGSPQRRALTRPFAFPGAPAVPRPLRTEPPGENALRTPRKAVGAPSVPAVRGTLCAPPGQTGGRGLQRDAGRPEPPRATAERVKHEENPAPVLGRHPARRPEFLPARSPQYRAGAEVRLRSSASSFLSSFYAAFGAMPPLGGTARRSTPCPAPPGCPPPPPPGAVPAARPSLPAFVPAASRRQARPARCQPPPPRRSPAAPPREPRPRRPPTVRLRHPPAAGWLARSLGPPLPARPGRPCRPPSVRTEPSRDSPPTALPRHRGGGPAEARGGHLLPGRDAAAILAAGGSGPVAPGDAEALAAVRGAAGR